MNENIKLERVTFFTRTPIISALEHLRVIGPLNYSKVKVLPGIIDGNINLENILSSQLVVFQRDFPEKLDEFESILILARSNSKPVIYDVDDLLIDLPENHPDRITGHYAKALLPMIIAMVEADYVTVATNKLKETLKVYNRNIIVLPNLLDDQIWPINPPKETTFTAPVTIGYMGGNSHEPDLNLIMPALLDISSRYQNNVKFNFYGIKPPEALAKISDVNWVPIQTYEYNDFAKDFQKFDADIVLAPLEDTLFNRCKSGIKYLEYTSLGLPGIYSNLEPYNEIVVDHETGLLATSLDEWRDSIIKLIENPELRHYIAHNAQSDVQKNWLMRKKAHLWLNSYIKFANSELNQPKAKVIKVRDVNRIAKQLAEFHSQVESHLVEVNNQLASKQQALGEVNNQLASKQQALVEVNNQLALKQQALDKSNQQIAELNSHLVEVNNQLASKQYELNEIYISKSWKVAMFLRNARVKLLPPDSKLYSFLRSIYRSIFIPRNLVNIRFKPNKNNKSPLISVVIPIYDRTQLLIESIESILHQTYQNFELILVCDGSPPETLEIVKHYENTSQKVRAFYFKNNSGNAVRGRNKGIKEARGEYLAFQDSDDIAEPDRLKTSLDAIRKFNADVVYGGWRALVDGTREIGINNGDEFFSPDCDINMLKKICVPCQSTVMARVSALRSVGGFNSRMKYREDHELWLRLAYNGYSFKSIDKILTNLRLHKGNLEIQLKENDKYWKDLMLEEFSKKITLKPKIGYVIPGTGISGGIAVICEHANRLIERGYDVSLISEDNNDNISWFPNLLAEVFPLSKAEINYDILVATGWTTAYTVNKLVANRKFYFVQSDESRFYDKNDFVIQKVLKTYGMDFIYFTEARWIQNWLKTEFSKDATYVPNGLNEKHFYPDVPLIPKGEKLRVLLEGPIDIPFKGMDDAIEAVKDLDIEVWIVSSSGKPKPGWKVDKFFHKVPFNMMRKIYSSCDILLKMSRVEGFFGPPLEMMACGGAVVVSKVTGYDEYIVDGYNALVVEMGDIDGAKAAVKRLIEDANLRNNLIKNGLMTAAQWRWETTIDVLEKLFYISNEKIISN